MRLRSGARLGGPLAAIAAACVAFGLGCVHHHHRPAPPAAVVKPGPPPWAPAHGYRRKHAHGTELVYDARLGVYLVVGLKDHFFHDGHYYRRTAASWEVSGDVGGPWVVVGTSRLPAGLRAHRAKHGRGGPHGHPAKNRH